MLLGEFHHTLDAKGRVFVPSRWREELSSGVVVAKGLDNCLYVMQPGRFQELVDRLRSLPLERQTNRDYSRMLFSGASEESIDKQGRMTIPPGLRSYASLAKDVVLVGVSDRAEIWDRQAWESYQGRISENYEQIAEQLES